MIIVSQCFASACVANANSLKVVNKTLIPHKSHAEEEVFLAVGVLYRGIVDSGNSQLEK